MKRALCLFLAVMLLLPALGSNIGTARDSYDLALSWILDSEFGYKDIVNVENALSALEAAPTAKFYYQMKQYLSAIIGIHEAGFKLGTSADISVFNLRKLAESRGILIRLNEEQEFIDELRQLALPLPDELDTYIRALIYERREEYEEAEDAYSKVLRVFDSTERLNALGWQQKDRVYASATEEYEKQNYYEAYLLFTSLGDDYISEDGYFAFEKASDALKKHKEAHTFAPATCDKPATCRECGEAEGDPLGHDWQEATCTQPKTCVRCGATEGEPLGHKWKDATCTEAGVCIRCKAVGTDPTGHKWKEATCTEPKTCTICGVKEGEPLDHNWQPATYERPETCSRCSLTRGEKLKRPISEGDIVTFGNYPQTASGTDNTPIEWLVLEVQDDKALLISKYGLDCEPYNTSNVEVTWETCTLRTWLNDEFMNRAFTMQEQQAILTTTVDNSKSQDPRDWNTYGGNNTEDKVFLLSYAEANKYLNVNLSDNSNIARTSPTAYAKNRGAYTNGSYRTSEGADACLWRLRSPGVDQYRVACVSYVGDLYSDNVNRSDYADRPALWVDLGSISFSSVSSPLFYATTGRKWYHADPNCRGMLGAMAKTKAEWEASDKTACPFCLSGTDTNEIPSNLVAGDIVTYGKYPQTGANTDNRPIEWLVLDVQDDKALLISKYGLFAERYNDTYTEITWEKCSLRMWLNNEFINRAFTALEQQAILTTNVDNSQSQCYRGWGTYGGNNTQDKVFLLSYAEANKYFDVTKENKDNYKSRTSPTEFAKTHGSTITSDYKTSEGVDACMWWLRSPGSSQHSAASVYRDGSLTYFDATHIRTTVRPAFWINLNTAVLG